MLRIAVLENERVAKDIIFELSKIMDGWEWKFVHFTKISEFAKADTKQFFDIVFFNETFMMPRISASFVETHVKRIVFYCMNSLNDHTESHTAERILYIDRSTIKSEMKRIQAHLGSLLKSHKEYTLAYHNVFIPLQIQDIYYIEKSGKSLVFHSTRGEFHERKTMNEAQEYFQQYDFLRVHSSYLVNVMYIVKIEQDRIVLSHKEIIPLARARRKEVNAWFHAFVKRSS